MQDESETKPKMWTLSNGVTLLRPILAIPIVVDLLRAGEEPVYWALFLFVVAALSDGFDGYLARRRNEATELGAMLDPVADKVFGTIVFAALVYVGLLPAWLFWVLLGKEALLLLGGVLLLRGQGRTLPARPLGKVATVILFIGFAGVLAGFHTAGWWLSLIGVLLSVGAGIDYAVVAGGQRNNSSIRGED